MLSILMIDFSYLNFQIISNTSFTMESIPVYGHGPLAFFRQKALNLGDMGRPICTHGEQILAHCP
jgi:hypothetical protein